VRAGGGILELLRESNSFAMTTADLAEATGRSQRQIRTAVHALADRELVILTHEKIGWAGLGEYGHTTVKRWSSDKDVKPFKIVKKGEHYRLSERGWSWTALRDLELIKIGTPVHGLRVWLPDRRADWERREAERLGKIRELLGKSTE
jgi:hypothetical protein